MNIAMALMTGAGFGFLAQATLHEYGPDTAAASSAQRFCGFFACACLVLSFVAALVALLPVEVAP
ncbi:MAG: hypothetical protein MK098_15420 [Marinovum sp.]|nr:hypothetical protein [Marinovum sp.]